MSILEVTAAGRMFYAGLKRYQPVTTAKAGVARRLKGCK